MLLGCWGVGVNRGPPSDINISILQGYPYLIGLHKGGIYMRHPYPVFCLCALFGRPSHASMGLAEALAFQGLGLMV